MSTGTLLPPAFAALEKFADFWAAETLSGRDQRRLDSSPAERADFYEAARDLIPGAMDYLDTKSLDQFDDRDERLMNMMLSLIHVALAIEVQRGEEHIHAAGARNMPITRGHSDRCN